MLPHARWRWELLLSLLIALITLALVASANQWSNCGGNSAALWSVRLYLDLVYAPLEALHLDPDADLAALLLADAASGAREGVREVAESGWLRGRGHFLVDARPIETPAPARRRVVIVFDQP